MSPFRPDLVDVWVFRATAARGLEILLMRRSAAKVLAGMWQGVSGSLEPGEGVVAGALRELREETGIEGAGIVAFFHLDQVNQFFWADSDAVVSAAVFAARVAPDIEPRLSHEHDELRWVDPAEAAAMVVWPAYRTAIERIRDDLADPARATWFELGLDGRRKTA